MTAWLHRDRSRLDQLTRDIDAAVVAGLAACGLPRSPVNRIVVEDFGRGWRGRKSPACDLLLDGDEIVRCVQYYGAPDDVFRTWIHESLHGRQPYDLDYRREQELAIGYEEGMVEGLTRCLLDTQPTLIGVPMAFPFFVLAYQTLAEYLDWPVEGLWRWLWQSPPGLTRQAFPQVVTAIRAQHGRPVHAQDRILLMMTTDRLFARTNWANGPLDATGLRGLWRRVLP